MIENRLSWESITWWHSWSTDTNEYEFVLFLKKKHGKLFKNFFPLHPMKYDIYKVYNIYTKTDQKHKKNNRLKKEGSISKSI